MRQLEDVLILCAGVLLGVVTLAVAMVVILMLG